MRSGFRLNLLSASSKCLDSSALVVDSILTFVDNHKFVEQCNIYVSDDKTFISVNFMFVDSDNLLNNCRYVLSFIDNLYLRHHTICHMVYNYSPYSK